MQQVYLSLCLVNLAWSVQQNSEVKSSLKKQIEDYAMIA